RPVVGEFTPTAALERLLEGSGLQYEWANERTVAIREAREHGIKPTAGDSSGQATMRVAQSKESAAADQEGARGANSEDPSAMEGKIESVAGLDEIVVTAQKREERLVDVPQSVSVLSSDYLNKIGAVQFADFANNIPGLQFSTLGSGQINVSMRGVTLG